MSIWWRHAFVQYACVVYNHLPGGDNKGEMTEFGLLGAMNLEMRTIKDPGLAWQALNETGSCDSLSLLMK